MPAFEFWLAGIIERRRVIAKPVPFPVDRKLAIEAYEDDPTRAEHDCEDQGLISGIPAGQKEFGPDAGPGLDFPKIDVRLFGPLAAGEDRAACDRRGGGIVDFPPSRIGCKDQIGPRRAGEAIAYGDDGAELVGIAASSRIGQLFD